MMQKIKYPDKKDWEELLKRPSFDSSSLEETVKSILYDVKANGDDAVRKFTLQFDKASVDQLRVSSAEIDLAERFLSPDLKKAILEAKSNIEKFHAAQLKDVEFVETIPGVQCWRRPVP